MRSTLLALALVIAAGCRKNSADADADGFGDDDCAAYDALSYPGAPELCDGRDNDCDGAADNGVGETWYGDADADGFGDEATASVSCLRPEGAVALGGDCDDDDAQVHPGASEACSVEIDADCDGVAGGLDGDDDGFVGCLDCDDADALVSPDAEELCNGGDDNCDGTIDEEATDAPTWYADLDADGFGGDRVTVLACEAPEGFLEVSDDCDDLLNASFPNAPELCDGRDNDCDDLVDDGATGLATWYLDADVDGFGDPTKLLSACAMPPGHVGNPDDCNDADPAYNPDATESCSDTNDYNCDNSVGQADADADGTPACSDCDDNNKDAHPGAIEACDGVDNDCNGQTDETAPTWFADLDGDGSGDAGVSVVQCAAPAGFVGVSGDCDDLAADVNPAATEACDGVDGDCSGAPDANETDADGDHWFACDGDCDDAVASVHPGAYEACNATDDDCDGNPDPGPSAWYADVDDDGFGNAKVSAQACVAPAGFVADDKDCNDLSAKAYPSAAEVCNGADDNCDGSAAGEADTDNDGWRACANDCDDVIAAVHPTATETCNSRDDDCNGTKDDNAVDGIVWFIDGDADGYGLATGTKLACTQPSGYAVSAGDCNDTKSTIRPGAPELCSSVAVDDDCDGNKDESDAADAVAWYQDADSDLHGTPTNFALACTQPAGRVSVADDCNDANNKVFGGATDVWYDGVDSNCDGKNDFDQDGDGATSFSKAGGADCNDTNPSVLACGLTATSAAASCAAVQASDDTLPSGAYFIDPAGTGAYQVYCDMDNNGGGWTLILKTAAGSTTLQYASTLWTTNTTTLVPTSLNVAGGVDAKFASYNNLPFRELRGCAQNGVLINCVQHDFGTSRPSPYAVFSGPEIHVLPEPNPAGNAPLARQYRDAFYNVFGPTGMRDCLPQETGFNIDAGDGNLYRWGFANNIPSQVCQELETDDADGVIGWGLTGQDCGATGAGYTSYFRNDTPCGGTERSFDSWLWVR